jgi:solute carrier family 26 (sodium-independent sulfate anion transporter), member 11
MASKSTATQIGHGLAKVLRIKVGDPNQPGADLSRGESVFSVSSADTYVEEEPTSWEWIKSIIPTPRAILLYFYNLFPFLKWILKYNFQWLIGDLIAGMQAIAQR